MGHYSLWSCLAIVFLFVHTTKAQCDLADSWTGEWYSYENNQNTYITFKEEVGLPQVKHTSAFENGFLCIKKTILPTSNIADSFESAIIVISNEGRTCYGCMEIAERTPNILEYRLEQCTYKDVLTAEDQCKGYTTQERNVAFRTSPERVNCKETVEGVWQFQHEIVGLTQICSRPDSLIVACQEPGSPLKDNLVYQQTFNLCSYSPNVLNVLKSTSYEYRCYGTWMSEDPGKSNFVYSAVMDTSATDHFHAFRCMLTLNDQQLEDNKMRFSMSLTPSCREVTSDFTGPIKIEAQPVIDEYRLKELKPSCNLPKNFTGTWFTSSEYDSNVKINSTHMHFNTLYSTYESKDTYFTCQETRDTRFLMKQVTQGRCEIEYVCMEFLPRHQNILRFRIGKPYQGDSSQYGSASLASIFSIACQWSAFTVSREENRNYNYQIMILNPPAPINCPIGGVYKFEQQGLEEFKYYTRIRGVTERPRVKVLCDRPESEWKTCSQDPKTIMLDVERCATLDHVGRPIGEYDEPDNYLQCAGFWQENQKSYLVTYDTEDPVSLFRCWVYERQWWRTVQISRALRAACGPYQLPNSSSHTEGASLSLLLTENEREFDNCPQRFYDGQNPYEKEAKVYVLGKGGASTVGLSCLAMMITLPLALLF